MPWSTASTRFALGDSAASAIPLNASIEASVHASVTPSPRSLIDTFRKGGNIALVCRFRQRFTTSPLASVDETADRLSTNFPKHVAPSRCSWAMAASGRVYRNTSFRSSSQFMPWPISQTCAKTAGAMKRLDQDARIDISIRSSRVGESRKKREPWQLPERSNSGSSRIISTIAKIPARTAIRKTVAIA